METILKSLERALSPSSDSLVHLALGVVSSSTGSQIVAMDTQTIRGWIQEILLFIRDAEEREIKDSGIRLWLDELWDAAHDAQDVLEGLEYESRLDSLVAAPQQTGIKRSRRDESTPLEAPTPTRSSLLQDRLFGKQIFSKISGIARRFNKIYESMFSLGLKDLSESRSQWAVHPAFSKDKVVFLPMVMLNKSRVSRGLKDLSKRPDFLKVDEDVVYGRASDLRTVVDMLLLSDDDEDVRIVSIVGVGGVGKTTLARRVFNDERVADHFETRLWVCVSSGSLNVTKLTGDILKQLLGRSYELQELGSLQQQQLLLEEELGGKMFLLVLDDVWDVSQECWDMLWVSLINMGVGKGSRVLLTTRNESVSRASRAMDVYPLGCLSDDDCWSLLVLRAFGGWSKDHEYQNLVPTGREIVRRCRGLPLAVKMIAAPLLDDFRADRWEDILRSDLWELPEGESYILPALKLS